MIKLSDGELKDNLPIEFTRQPQMLGISYALKMAYQMFLTYQVQIYAYAFVDQAPEYVLDLLATELRVKYYSADLDIDTKREIIKNAMTIALKDGTKFAVDRLVQIIYGGGEEVEWYDYNGIPNHFRLEIEALKTFDFEIILAILDYVKRKTARLDGITLISRHRSELYFGGVTASYNRVKTDGENVEIDLYDAESPVYVGHINLIEEYCEVHACTERTVFIFDGNGQEAYRILVDENGRILYE